MNAFWCDIHGAPLDTSKKQFKTMYKRRKYMTYHAQSVGMAGAIYNSNEGKAGAF